jgi:hypothetical protein
VRNIVGRRIAMSIERIPLAELPRVLRDRYGIQIKYRTVYQLVLDGELPAEKDQTSRRWLVASEDLNQIAEALAA